MCSLAQLCDQANWSSGAALLANLLYVDCAVAESLGVALGPGLGLCERVALQDREAGDQLLRFGEGPIHPGLLAARSAQASATRARAEALRGEQRAGLLQLAHHGVELG